MQRALAAGLLALASCKSNDPQPYLDRELAFVQVGVQLANEEKEVRRVLGQRGLRVVARRDDPAYTALGAATRDRHKSAIRVISRRGVVFAEDAAVDDLFAPGTLALLEHFGGQTGAYLFVAHARIAPGHDVGCVTLQNVLPDGTVEACPLDVSLLGSRACVSNLAPGPGGHIQATVAWPSLYALGTPQLGVELALPEPALGQEAPRSPVAHLVLGPWLEEEAKRLSTLRLGRAEFSRRHAAGVLRAAVALLSGKDRAIQLDAYRNAVSDVLPGSPEAQVVADTTAHIQRGWLDARDDEAPKPAPVAAPEPPIDPDATVIEPGATAEPSAPPPSEDSAVPQGGATRGDPPARDDAGATVIEPETSQLPDNPYEDSGDTVVEPRRRHRHHHRHR